MCGIIGIVGGKIPEGYWGDAYYLTRSLFMLCEHRGKDATGYAARTAPLDSPTSAATLIAKRAVPAGQFVNATDFTRLQHRRCSSLVGHCRAATHGSPKFHQNNHPHVGKRLALVHNGVCTNASELEEQFLLELDSLCDSEAILKLIEKEPDTLSGLSLALKVVKGSMAVALYDTALDCVWLASNGGRPLWLAHYPKLKLWMFASTDSIILRAMRETFGKGAAQKLDYLAPIPDFTPLVLTPAGLVYAPRMP